MRLTGITWLPMGLGLLFVEYLAISYVHDAQPLVQRGGWQGALGYLGSAGPLGAVVLTATLLVGGRGLLDTLGSLLQGTERPALKAPWLLANLAAFAALMWTTGSLLASLENGSETTGTALGFVFAALCTGLCGLCVAISPARWPPLVRALRGPLALGLCAGLLAWGAGLVSAELWHGLSGYTMTTVAALIAPFTSELVYYPEEAIVGTETFYVVIAPICSGYEGIGLIAVFVGLYLVVARDRLRFPHAWVLLPLAVLTVWLGNSLRIALLIGVGILISPDIALGGFHSKAGWLFFCAVALGTVAVAQRWRFVSPAPSPSSLDPAHPTARLEEAELENPTALYLMPLLALIGTKLLTGLFVDDFDYLYPVAVVAVVITLVHYRKGLPRPSWPPSWHGPLIGAVVFPLWLLTFPTLDPDAGLNVEAGLAELGAPWAAIWIAFRVVGSCITVPIVEELAFRGFLMRRLIDADFESVSFKRLTPLAVVVSSLAFGALHQAYIGGTIAGLAYVLAQWSRGRIGDAIVAHAVTNSLIALDVLVRGNWYLWG